jgi:hypothetical protein
VGKKNHAKKNIAILRPLVNPMYSITFHCLISI